MNASAGSTDRLRLALIATAVVAVIEFVGGLRAGSLALLADSAHVAMDVVALGIALAAAFQARRPATSRQTFGFARYETLAALANGGLLTAVTVLIAVEAVRRFWTPELPSGSLMTIVAAIGFVINLGIGVMLLRGGHGHHHGHTHAHDHGDAHDHDHDDHDDPRAKPNDDLNMRAALLHVAGDALGAAAVVVGGIIIGLTGAAWLDPLLSLFVAAIILYGVVAIVRQAADVLLESAPQHAETPAVSARIGAVNGVVGVHDLHVWTIGAGSYALSAHVVLDDRRLSEATQVLRSIDNAMRDEFSIGHVTVQFECESCDPDTTVICSPRPLESANS